MRICVIDDNELILDALTLLLRDRGHEIFSAKNALDGIELVRRENPDLVVIDLNLAETRGDAVVRDIRALDQAMPIVLTSGHAAPPHDALGGPNGADLFLAKPFTPGALIESYARILAQRGEAA